MTFLYFTLIGTGIAWTLTYLALVYRGFKDKTYGMPLVPLALNFAWEVTFAVVYPPHHTGMLIPVSNAIWMTCDVGIIATYFIYGYKHFVPYRISKPAWITFSLIAFAASFGIMLLGGPFFAQFSIYFNNDLFESAKFIAFIQNSVMSVCFVAMAYTRRSSAGQSLTIAVCKWIGTPMTVGLSYLFVDHPGEGQFIAVFVGVIFIFDVWYIIMVYQQLLRDKINPWTRF